MGTADTKSLVRNVVRCCPRPLTQTLGFLETALCPELSGRMRPEHNTIGQHEMD